MRTPLLALALAAFACAPRSTPLHTAPPPAHPAPLVVTMVIDQFAAWVAEARLPALPDDGGFARLRREGAWYRHVRYVHAATDTAPGHSSLYTGRPPRESGIHANELPDGHGARVSFLRDESAHVVTEAGPTDSIGSSIARLRGDTLADELRERVPGAVIVSVSLKDRGAIFGGGRRPDATLWFDPSRDRFVTSTAFAQHLPAWVDPDGGTAAMQALRAQPWTPLDPAWLRAHAATPDDQRGEGDLEGFGTTFPHDFGHARRPPGAMRFSPRGDDAVLRLAEDAVAHARRPDAPMLLAISLSSNDYVGHLFGPDSWEAWDELRHLDAALGHFMDRLDALAGRDGWTLVLSADHGTVALPEVLGNAAAMPWCAPGAAPDPYERPCGPAGRLDPDAVAADLQSVAVRAIGPGAWVRGIADPYVYLTPEAEALAAVRREALQSALAARLRELPGIERVIDVRTVPAACPDADTVEARLCRSIPAGTGAALYAQARAGWFFDAGYALGFGTSHGSPYLFDRTVPLLVRAPGVAHAGSVVDEPMPFTAFRRWGETLLGLRPQDPPGGG